ncbi:MAG: hypothetical protein VX438_13145 [Planctomycetota bacterium]|nr:hypothetical protein [Planctomycetota bacterium]
MFTGNIFKTSKTVFIVTVSLLLSSPFSSWQRHGESQEPLANPQSADHCVCGKESTSGQQIAAPCKCHEPDFIYHPKTQGFKGKYTRIQDCQSKMTIRPGDEFWWISTRHLPLDSCKFNLCYYRYQNSISQKSNLQELKTSHQQNPNLINFVYIHENRADINKSEMRFWQNYNILISQAPDAPPVRYIFFSWPADQIRGQIKDVKEKAVVCDYHAYYLAWFLCQIKDFNRVSLGGYSYGCRMGLDALHIAGGGSKKCRTLPESMLVKKPTFRAAFVATAMQNRCTEDEGFHRFAYATLKHITFLNNSNDQVLKAFHLLSENGAAAIGREGICVSQLDDGGQRLTQINACSIAGRSHKLEDYYKSEQLRQEIRNSIFWR